MPKKIKILSIETSCDETAMAVLEAEGGLKSPHFKVLKNVVSSQIETHRPWGGVVPNLAKREHLKNLPIVFDETVDSKPETLNPDIVAVTVGPGLEPCLWTGVEFAKEVSKKYFPKAKLFGINHMEGHLYSFLLTDNFELKTKDTFPAVGLVVSGGHTILLLLKSLTKWTKLGETRDDAVGECFDKVGRLLNLPFPGGPEIEKMARTGNPQAIAFPRPMLKEKNFDFSFSGLKTSVLYYMKNHPKADVADVTASFQQAAVDVLITKTAKAVLSYGAKSIILAGGVAANRHLREAAANEAKKLGVNLFAPGMQFNTDNASMIGAAAYIAYLQKKNRKITAQSNLNL
jgi:N6-L-threonylcarbamoyladenine synthase